MYKITPCEGKNNAVYDSEQLGQLGSQSMSSVSKLGISYLTDGVGKDTNQQHKQSSYSLFSGPVFFSPQTPPQPKTTPSEHKESSYSLFSGPVFFPTQTPPKQKQNEKVPFLVYRLFKGSQAECNGSVDSRMAFSYIKSLNKTKENGVVFEPSRLSSSLEGGTCCVMAFDFANSYFKLRKEHLNTLSDDSLFLASLQKLKLRLEKSNEEFRTCQAAFNTIRGVEVKGEIDIRRNIIQSLASLYSFKIIDCSERVSIANSTDCQKKVQSIIFKLKEGVHFLELTCSVNNHNRKRVGHAMVYVKTERAGFIYDSNRGLTHIVDGNEHGCKEIFSAMTYYLEEFQTSKARFYRLNLEAIIPKQL